LHHGLDPVVDGACAPFQALLDLKVDVHQLSCSFQNVAILNVEEIFQYVQKLLGFCNKIKYLHYRHEHWIWDNLISGEEKLP